jgi:hypothetical protein
VSERSLAIINAGRRKCFRRQRVFSAYFERDRFRLGAEKFDRQHLPFLFLRRLPAFDAGGRYVEDVVPERHGDLQLIDLAAQDLKVEHGLRVDQAVGNADIGDVLDGGQHFHYRRSADARMPAGGDFASRSQLGRYAGGLPVPFHGKRDKLGRDLDRLVGGGNRQLERGDSGRGTIELEPATVGGRMDPGGEFELNRKLARFRQQQRVGSVTGADEQRLCVGGGEFTDGGGAESNRQFHPSGSENLHRQRGVDAGDVFLHTGDVPGFGHGGRNGRFRGTAVA